MTTGYERPPDPGEGLRLHLNEHTGGCSPSVLEALRRLTATDAAFYPDYTAVSNACAAWFGVTPDRLVLTNGLDEGLYVAALLAFRGTPGDGEALIVEPAFDMYRVCAEAHGGRVVAIAPRPDFSFPTEDVRRAISPRTRLVYLTNPNNPTGQRIPREAIEAVARAAAPALVMLDEAYADFSGETFLDGVDRFPNVLVGRTFAKAFGLAALRVGALLAHPETLRPVRVALPPFNLNVCAMVALGAALEDRDHVARYVEEVTASKVLVYDACRRLGLTCWPSAANFVLVRVGPRASELVERLAARRIFIRDRSSEPGCDGCVRITTGLVAHTRTCIAAMEEILCDAR